MTTEQKKCSKCRNYGSETKCEMCFNFKYFEPYSESNNDSTRPSVSEGEREAQILEIIKDESEKANVRKYTCINGFGYSQFERNIADRIIQSIPPARQPEWIRSVDQLPIENVQVLCWNGYRMVQDSWMQHTDQNAEWFVQRFTHWMPLLEKPKQ